MLQSLVGVFQNIMGNGPNKQQRIVPERGYRVISITKKHVASQLNLLTDYIISPDPKLIDLRRDTIRLQVFSTLSQQIRTVELQIINRQLGLQVRLDDINTCVLRVTKIFQGSPLQNHQIQVGDFIVGVLEGNFTCIKTFAQLVSSITVLAPKSNVSLGICGEDGKTRIVVIPVSELKTWQAKRKGLLGCQLAQGWIHKWKPSKQKKGQSLQSLQPQQQPPTQTQHPLPLLPQPSIPSQSQPHSDHSDSSQQIDRKCDQIDKSYNNEGIMQTKYKGILRSQQIIDASTICRCRPINKLCQKCFIQKDQNYYFFNCKNNQIVGIPIRMMMTAEE